MTDWRSEGRTDRRERIPTMEEGCPRGFCLGSSGDLGDGEKFCGRREITPEGRLKPQGNSQRARSGISHLGRITRRTESIGVGNGMPEW